MFGVIRHAVFRRQHGAVLDALRRSTELLDGGTTPYYREEVGYIQKVNRRLLRAYDPNSSTDRKVR
jgi:hypothetical protein